VGEEYRLLEPAEDERENETPSSTADPDSPDA